MNRSDDPPNPIDNLSIVTNPKYLDSSTSGSQTLRLSSDHMSISKEIWELFHSIYGGGPEVVSGLNGVVNVNSCKPSFVSPKLKDKTSNSSEGKSAKSERKRITRAKAEKICEHYVQNEKEEIDDQEDKIEGISD